MKILECVPNISEGRDAAIIEAIAQGIRSVKDVKLLHVDSGYAANHTVFTFVATPPVQRERLRSCVFLCRPYRTPKTLF